MSVQTDPYTFTNGTTADALEVNARYDPLYTLQNGAIDADNMDLTDAYAWTGAHSFAGINTHTKQYFSTAKQLTDGATIALDWNDANVQYVTLAGNRTFTFANPKQGGRYIIILIQDGSGSRTITWPTIKWTGGSAPTLTTAAAELDMISLVYANSIYVGAVTPDCS